MFKKHDLVKGIKVGDVITAELLNSIAAAVNANTSAIARPGQVDIPAGETGGGGDQVWTAAAGDITDETVQITDSNSDTHDIERITSIVFTNAATGETMTLNISYT